MAFPFFLRDVAQDARWSITANDVTMLAGTEPTTTMAHMPSLAPRREGLAMLQAGLLRALPLDWLRAQKRKVGETLHRLRRERLMVVRELTCRRSGVPAPPRCREIDPSPLPKCFMIFGGPSTYKSRHK